MRQGKRLTLFLLGILVSGTAFSFQTDFEIENECQKAAPFLSYLSSAHSEVQSTLLSFGSHGGRGSELLLYSLIEYNHQLRKQNPKIPKLTYRYKLTRRKDDKFEIKILNQDPLPSVKEIFSDLIKNLNEKEKTAARSLYFTKWIQLFPDYSLLIEYGNNRFFVPSHCYEEKTRVTQDLIHGPFASNVLALDYGPVKEATISDSPLSDYFLKAPYVDSLQLTPPREIENFRFHLSSNSAFEARFRAIDYNPVTFQINSNTDIEAIDLVYLTFWPGYSSQLFFDALRSHAKIGTKVRLLLPHLPGMIKPETEQMLRELQREGVQIGFFKNNWLSAFNKFFHPKMLLVRRKSSSPTILLGGRNMSDAYFFTPAVRKDALDPEGIDYYFKYKQPSTYPNRQRAIFHDLDMELKSEPLYQDLNFLYDSLWNWSTQKKTKFEIKSTLQEMDTLYQSTLDLEDLKMGQVLSRSFLSTPFNGDHTFKKVLIKLIGLSQKKINLVTPYYILDDELRSALRDAVLRGVEINLYSVTNYGNDDVLKWQIVVQKKHLNDAVDIGVHVYQWVHPIVLHAKTASFDDQLVYVGSGNLNSRSFRHDLEDGLLLMGGGVFKAWEKEVLSPIHEISSPYQKMKMSLFDKIAEKTFWRLF